MNCDFVLREFYFVFCFIFTWNVMNTFYNLVMGTHLWYYHKSRCLWNIAKAWHWCAGNYRLPWYLSIILVHFLCYTSHPLFSLQQLGLSFLQRILFVHCRFSIQQTSFQPIVKMSAFWVQKWFFSFQYRCLIRMRLPCFTALSLVRVLWMTPHQLCFSTQSKNLI